MKEDQLLKNPIDFSTFSNTPLILLPDLLPEQILSPTEGVIDSKISMNTLHFEIATESPKIIQFDYGVGKQEVTFKIKNDTIHFTIPVQTGIHSLLIYFDEKPILGYKVI